MKRISRFLKKVITNRTSFYFPKYSGLFMIAIILTFAYFYKYQDIINLRPQGAHQWRQCDCLSLTSNLYSNESDFFHPEIYNLLEDNEGRTASDFPLIYYIVSLLWKVFGKHEWIYRLLNFIISIFGMLALLKIFENFLKDSFWSLFSVAVLFTSGIYVYYSLNFLMNTIALNISFIGWYYFFRFYKNKQSRYLYITFLFFLLAGLLKMSSLISFLALCGLFFFEWVKVFQKKDQEVIFEKKVAFIVPATIVLLLILTWVSYVQSYNERWNKGVFLVGILPIWELSKLEISAIIENVRHIWLEEYFYRPIHIFLLIGLLSTWVFNRKSDRSLQILTSLISIGFVGIVILFFSPLGQHDYYVIDLLILSVFILLSFFTLLIRNRSENRLIDLTILKLVSVAFLILSVSHTSKKMENRYKGWLNQRHQTEFFGYADIEPYLDSLGIGPSAKVISMNDPSISISLYLMNRHGWSAYGTNMKDSTLIARRIEMGAEYLLFHNEIDYSINTHWYYFIEDEIGKHKNVTICKIGLSN